MIYVNEVYKFLQCDKYIRIIDIDNELNRFYYVTLYTNLSNPKLYNLSAFIDEINQELVLKVPDPYFKIIREENLSIKEKERRDFNWQIVNNTWFVSKENLLSDKKRSETFKQLQASNNLSEMKVRRLFTRFFQRGMNKNAMLSDYSNSGGKGKDKILSTIKTGRPKKVGYSENEYIGINITPDIKKIFDLCIDKYYRTKKQVSYTEVYNSILKEYFSYKFVEDGKIKYKVWEKDRIPTYGQFYYWVKKLEQPTKDIIQRKGQKEYELKYRPILSNSTSETIGPGSRFQVDATVADIYLVSKFDRHRIIGRPIVYAIIDVFSRLVTGIYVGLEGPSWTGAMMALSNMVSDKVEFCKTYNIDIDKNQWPANHLPQIILADRGEFEGYSVENLINNLGVNIENTPPYRGDLKGIVERSFKTLNTKLKHKAPGAIMKEFRTRGDRDYRLDATLTIEEFTKLYIQLIIHHNNSPVEDYPMQNDMLVDGIIPIPTSLWEWGIENRKGTLRTVDSEIMKLNVLPKGRANVSRVGIKFKGLFYGSKKAIEEQWFTSTKIRRLDIIYDPRDMSYIYIPDVNGMQYEKCYLLEGSLQYTNAVMEDIIFIQELQSELLENQKQEKIQRNIDLEKEIDIIIKQAEKDKKVSIPLYDQSNTKKLRSVKANRIVEKEINKSTEAFELGQVNNDLKTRIIELRPKQKLDDRDEPEESDTKKELMNKLRRKRDERREK